VSSLRCMCCPCPPLSCCWCCPFPVAASNLVPAVLWLFRRCAHALALRCLMSVRLRVNVACHVSSSSSSGGGSSSSTTIISGRDEAVLFWCIVVDVSACSLQQCEWDARKKPRGTWQRL
jgi:hypothetical protein